MIKRPNFNLINKLSNNYNGYLHFSLNELGINIATLKDFHKSYNNLYIDEYVQTNPPTRLRRFAKYDINVKDGIEYIISFNPSTILKQDVPDFRSKERIYNNIENKFIYSEPILNLITNISGLICKIHPHKINNLSINFHQVRLISYSKNESDNSPEGIHQDGADYIVSALVLDRHNVTGGESRIYDENKNKILFEKKLNKNEMIFQEDRSLWHDVTPIQSLCKEKLGFRDIIGLDIIIDK